MRTCRNTGSPGPHRRRVQRGSTSVEFPITITLSLILMFAIIELAIAMYNQGILVQAARVAARESSLFWVDPTRITSTSDPKCDQRVDETSREAKLGAWEGYLVSFSSESVNETWGTAPACSSTSSVSGQEVSLRLDFNYRGPVTSALATFLDLNLISRSRAWIE